MKIIVENLIVETTERCNANCRHCIRGNQRNIDMTSEIVDKILDNVDIIGSVAFTGGEPVLNLDIIKYFFDEIRMRNRTIGFFWMATNGLIKQVELATILLEAIELCDEQSLCGVAISIDEFHDKKAKHNPLKFLSFYDNSKEFDGPRPVINMGRAAENGISTIDITPYLKLNSEVDTSTESVSIETLYVRCDGKVYADCDISYEFMDKNPIMDICELRKSMEDLYQSCIDSMEENA